MAAIVTLTANPSLDRTVTLSEPLLPGSVQRARASLTQPGGKGINVARVLHSAGADVVAVVPLSPTDSLRGLLDDVGLPYVAVATARAARVNVTLTDPAGVTTKVNEAGEPLATHTLDALVAALTASTDAGAWVVLSGSLPPGVSPSWYADLTVLLRQRGVRVAVDTSDAPLQAFATLLPDAAPDLLAPNLDELAQLRGLDASRLASHVAAGRLTETLGAVDGLVRDGVCGVLATLGAHGAIYAAIEGAWHASSPAVTPVSTVGAGDAALAGFLLARERGHVAPDALATAVSFGAAAVGLPGSTPPRPVECPTSPGVLTALRGPLS